MHKSILAIVGRPNVGKSTLFNRLAGKPLAVVVDIPGVTRDRHHAEIAWEGTSLILVDTGGLDLGAHQGLAAQVMAQTRLAVEEADAILCLMDAKDGLIPLDREIWDFLRSQGKPVFLVANKVDGPRDETNLPLFYELGVETLHPISSLHGRGVSDMMEAVCKAIPQAPPEEEKAPAETRPPRLAVVGRPNVGKSTLLNALLDKERFLTHDEPGTTRDAVDTHCVIRGKPYVFVDTAGIRRRGRIERGVEAYSVMRALRAIQQADVVLLVLDAEEGVTDQDSKLAGMVLEAGKGLVVVLNKCDLIEEEPEPATARSRHRLAFVDHAPFLHVSALTGFGLKRVLPAADKVLEACRRRVSTGKLNRILQKALARHSPPTVGGKPLKFFYGTQVGIQPPSFALFVNRPKDVPPTYRRYLENTLREALGLAGTPVRLQLRPSREGKP